MRRDVSVARLRQHESKQIGVEHHYLFGSTPRDKARQESVVDSFFDYPRGPLSLFEQDEEEP